MDEPVDLLQIKIEKAKSELPEETARAIDAVDWKGAIADMREKKGYNLEQLGELETETELVLSGLVNPDDYPKELQKRMRISRTQADTLVNEMNESVFKKIREELIKNTERNKTTEKKPERIIPRENKAAIAPPRSVPTSAPEKADAKTDTQVLSSAGIEILPAELEAPKVQAPPLAPLAKLADSFKAPTVKTEYTLNNISKASNSAQQTPPTPAPAARPASPGPRVDPYREQIK